MAKRKEDEGGLMHISLGPSLRLFRYTTHLQYCGLRMVHRRAVISSAALAHIPQHLVPQAPNERPRNSRADKTEDMSCPCTHVGPRSAPEPLHSVCCVREPLCHVCEPRELVVPSQRPRLRKCECEL
jgi:hypothetical protein